MANAADRGDLQTVYGHLTDAITSLQNILNRGSVTNANVISDINAGITSLQTTANKVLKGIYRIQVLEQTDADATATAAIATLTAQIAALP